MSFASGKYSEESGRDVEERTGRSRGKLKSSIGELEVDAVES